MNEPAERSRVAETSDRPPRRRTFQKVLAAGLLALFASGILKAASIALARDSLPIGAFAPALSFKSGGRAQVLSDAVNRRTLVIVYSPSCDHCRAELDALDRGIERTVSSKVILIAATADEIPPDFQRSWPHLRVASNVVWGQASIPDLKQRFGVTAIPALFVFEDGKLVRKFRGETKMAALFPGG
jgi:thiol-disulfide isomerase/thioredoxin